MPGAGFLDGFVGVCGGGMEGAGGGTCGGGLWDGEGGRAKEMELPGGVEVRALRGEWASPWQARGGMYIGAELLTHCSRETG